MDIRRILGQGPRLILGQRHLSMNTRAIDELTAPAKEQTEPVIPSEVECRTPDQILDGLGLDYGVRAAVDQELRTALHSPNAIVFRKSLYEILRGKLPRDHQLRSEVARRAVKVWKAVTTSQPGQGEHVIQKSWKDKLPGGLADKKQPKDFPRKALAAGVKVELEHTSDRKIATEIAMDHLAEDPHYYEKLATIEKSKPLYIGPKGGRWADPEHKHHYEEEPIGGAKGGAKRYQEELKNIHGEPIEGPVKPEDKHAKSEKLTVRSMKYRTEDELRNALALKLPKSSPGLIKQLKVTKIAEHVSRIDERTQARLPDHTEFLVELDTEAAIPGHRLLAHIDGGVVSKIDRSKSITKDDYDKAEHGDCDVCKTKRPRKIAYVVERESDGEHIIVGGECAKNFKGANLAKVVGDFDTLSDAVDELRGEEGGEGGGGRQNYDPQALVAAGWALAKKHGYKKRGLDGSPGTADLAGKYLYSKKLTPEEEVEFRAANEEIAKDWPKILSWAEDKVKEAEGKGQFDEFFQTIHTLLNRRFVDSRHLGRLAWVAAGYYGAKAKAREPKAEQVAYRGAPVGELHDLPGKWKVLGIKGGETQFGTYYGVSAVNDKGERIWFKQNSQPEFKPDDEIHLRGKIKGFSNDGKMTFLSHTKVRLGDEEGKAAKAQAKAEAKERKKALDAEKKKAGGADYWKETTPDAIRAQVEAKKLTRQGAKKAEALWNESLKGALKAGNLEALKHVDQAEDESLSRISKVEHTYKDYPVDARDLDKIVAEFPALKDWAGSKKIVNPAKEQAQRAFYDQERAAREHYESEQRKLNNWGQYQAKDPSIGPPYPSSNPLDYGVNLTGYAKQSTYAQGGIGPDPGAQWAMPNLKAFDTALKEAHKERTEAKATFNVGTSSYGRQHSRGRDLLPGVQRAWEEFTRGEADASKVEGLLEYAAETTNGAIKDIQEYPPASSPEDQATRDEDTAYLRANLETVKRLQDQFSALAPKPIEKALVIAPTEDWDAALEQIRPRLYLRETSHPLELVWMAEEVPDELSQNPRQLPPGWEPDLVIKGATHKYIKRVPTGKANPKYRYFYYVPGKGVVASDDLQEGSKFKITHEGQQGHFHVDKHDKESGQVTVTHDESGKSATLHKDQLAKMLNEHHAGKTKKAKPAGNETKETKPKEAKSKDKPGNEPETNQSVTESVPKKYQSDTKSVPKLEQGGLGDIEEGGFDQFEGLSKDPKELEAQAASLSRDREYKVIKHKGGYVLVSKEKKTKDAANKGEGASTRVVLRGSGHEIEDMPARWKVVEADSITPSHNAMTFEKRGDYPEGVQERPYHSDKQEQLGIENLARNIQPDIVINTNPDAINGAPIVTEHGIVLGGNKRSMGMQRMYERYPEQGKKLKEYLAHHSRSFGISPGEVIGMKQPILVRQVEAGKDPKKLTKLGRQMNEALTQGLDAKAKAVAVGKLVTQDVVDTLAATIDPEQTLATYLHTSASKPFVAQLEKAGIIDQRSRNQYVDSETGLLNEDGRQFASRALAARMIPDFDVLDKMDQSWRENLAQSVPSLLQAETHGWDLREALTTAIKADEDMASKGLKRTPQDRKAYTQQEGLFGPSTKPEIKAMLEVLQTYGKQSRGLPNGFQRFATEVVRQKREHGVQGTLFAMTPKTLIETLVEAFDLKDPGLIAKSFGLVDSFVRYFGLAKAEAKPDTGALKHYLEVTISLELENLLRQQAKVTEVGKQPDREKVLSRLRAFIVDTAHHDKRFAQGMGAQPVTSKFLDALLDTQLAM